MFALYMYDISYSRPEAYYFYGYFLAINFLWIIIPSGLIYDSVNTMVRAFRVLRAVESGHSSDAKALATEKVHDVGNMRRK